jgi:methylamine---glutamate N-methyltransferase subunit B
VRGSVAELGADCVEKDMRDEHATALAELLRRAGVEDVEAGEFRRYGSARTLYNFHPDNVGSY